MTPLRIACILTVVVLVAGCSNQTPDGRVAISGNVTLEGKPLEEGKIIFTPIDSQDTMTGVGIVNGRYEIDRYHGLKPGKYLVRITSGDGVTPDVPPSEEEIAAPGGTTNIMSVDRIPPEWNVRSDKQVEVTADGPNDFNFDIPKAVNIKARGKKW